MILFSQEELGHPLPLTDRRAWHILHILKCKPGDSFKAGVLNSRSGQARLQDITGSHLELAFMLENEPVPLYPVHLIAGLCRPQTVKKILQEATSLGVSEILFCGTLTGEKSYTTSKLWTKNEYLNYIKLGAEQAVSTSLPQVSRYYSLRQCLDTLQGGIRIAFDNHLPASSLCTIPITGKCYLAIGSERGWATEELQLLKKHDFHLCHLGKRVLRMETACVAAVSLALSALGYL